MKKKNKKIFILISVLLVSSLITYSLIFPLAYLTVKYKKSFIGWVPAFFLPVRYSFDFSYWDYRWKEAEWYMVKGDRMFVITADGLDFYDDYQEYDLINWVVKDLQQNVCEDIIYVDGLNCGYISNDEYGTKEHIVFSENDYIDSFKYGSPYIYVYCDDMSKYIKKDVSEYSRGDYIEYEDATDECIYLKQKIKTEVKNKYDKENISVLITNSKNLYHEITWDDYSDETVVLVIDNVPDTVNDKEVVFQSNTN